MSKYRVISPILHDWHPYRPGEEIDGDILSEGQAEELVKAGALEPIEDEAPVEAAPEAAAPAAEELAAAPEAEAESEPGAEAPVEAEPEA